MCVTGCLCFQNIQAEKEALADGKDNAPKYHRTEDGFIRIGVTSWTATTNTLQPARVHACVCVRVCVEEESADSVFVLI